MPNYNGRSYDEPTKLLLLKKNNPATIKNNNPDLISEFTIVLVFVFWGGGERIIFQIRLKFVRYKAQY